MDPLRCTSSCFISPSTMCFSTLAILWLTLLASHHGYGYNQFIHSNDRVDVPAEGRHLASRLVREFTSGQSLGGWNTQEGHGGAVHPSKVGCTRHGLQIVLPFLGVDSGTSQLPVVGLDVVTCHSSLHCCEGVSSYLVTKASAATVYHDAHLANLINPQFASCSLVKHFFYYRISAQWSPASNVSICGKPRFLARWLTLLGSACSIRPYSSQCSLSSAHAYPLLYGRQGGCRADLP